MLLKNAEPSPGLAAATWFQSPDAGSLVVRIRPNVSPATHRSVAGHEREVSYAIPPCEGRSSTSVGVDHASGWYACATPAAPKKPTTISKGRTFHTRGHGPSPRPLLAS